MTATVTPLLTTISDCESVTGWSGTPVLNTDIVRQNTNSLSKKVSATTFSADYTGSPLTGGRDFTGELIYVWFYVSTAAKLAARSAGGIGIRVGDGTNTGTWYVAGSDTYQGGWFRAVIDPNTTPDLGTKPTITAITLVGVYFNVLGMTGGADPNCFWDILHAGTGLKVTGGSAASPATFQDVYETDTAIANAYGIVDRQSGVYITRGKIQVGGTGSSDSFTFVDSGSIVVFSADVGSFSTTIPYQFYELRVIGNDEAATSFQLGASVGSGDDTIGISGVTIKAASTTNRFGFVTSGTIDSLSLYNLTLNGARRIFLGSSSNVSTINRLDMFDCTFNACDEVMLNVTGSKSFARNSSISSFVTASAVPGSASFALVNPTTITSSQYRSVLGSGFRSLNDKTTATLTVKDHDFTNESQYIRVYQDKTWDIVNPTWSPTTSPSDNLVFVSPTNTQVNERYSLDLTITNLAGTGLSGSVFYIYEGTTTNQLATSGSVASSEGTTAGTITKNEYTWDGSGGSPLTNVTYGSFALRVYKYPYTPFIASQAVVAAINSTVSLVSDSAVAQATQATALSDGAGILVEKHSPGETDGRPLKVIHFDTGAGTIPAAGQGITGSNSLASGTLVQIIGDATEGTLVLEGWNGVAFHEDDALTNNVTWTGLADLSASASSFDEEYTWLIDANSKTLQVMYDYLAARMAEDPVTQDKGAGKPFYDVIVWGQAEQSQLVYSSPAGYVTERNVARQQGVWIANQGAGTIAYLTADSGSQYIPPVSYSFTLTGLVADSEVRVYNATTDEEITGTESSSTSFSYSYTYTGDIDIYVVIFHISYKDIRLLNLTLSNSSVSIPIQQQTDRVYST